MQRNPLMVGTSTSSGTAITPSSQEILLQWMTHRPSIELQDAWIHYVQGLCEKLTSEEKAELKRELIENTRSVAMASGGFLGLGNKISKSESEILKKLENAFK